MVMTEFEVRERLLGMIGGSPISHWASANGLSNGYVQDFLKGRSPPGLLILRVLGLERLTVYRDVG